MLVVGAFSLDRFTGVITKVDSCPISNLKIREFVKMYEGDQCYSFEGYTWYVEATYSTLKCIITEFTFDHTRSSNTIQRYFG